MKNLVLIGIISLLTLSSCANQRNINQFYNKYQGAENTTSFKAPLFLASLLMQDSQEYALLRKKIKSIRVLTMNDIDASQGNRVQNDIKMALQKDGFENWFSMNEDGQVINVSTQNRGKSLKNLVISMQGSDNLVFINAKTNLTESELANFITTIVKNSEDDD